MNLWLAKDINVQQSCSGRQRVADMLQLQQNNLQLSFRIILQKKHLSLNTKQQMRQTSSCFAPVCQRQAHTCKGLAYTQVLHPIMTTAQIMHDQNKCSMSQGCSRHASVLPCSCQSVAHMDTASSPKTVVSLGPTQSKIGPTNTGPKFSAKMPTVHKTANLLSCVGQSVSDPPAFRNTVHATHSLVMHSLCYKAQLENMHALMRQAQLRGIPSRSAAQPVA